MNSFLHVQVKHNFSGAFSLNIHLDTAAQRLGLTGPSGSGKTTLLHSIAGIFQPDSAHIQVGEHTFCSATQCMPPRARRVGLVTQDALLFPHLSVTENLCFGAHSEASADTMNEVTSMLEIEHLIDRRVQHLSGGERQRVALGRALISKPRLLLADEPLSAVDLERRQRLVPKIYDFLNQHQLPIVWVSHDHRVIDALCEKTACITSGTLVLNE